jgi:aspartyl-tRNA(Asn)/glutamyl-tRNA(Gln) amidotransferase subunit B
VVTENLKTKTIVGLEIHVQLATRTKLFCGCALEFGAEPNSRTCPVCLGLPGALPVMNRTAYDYAVRLALAMNCRIAEFTKWDRKSYYYPDLPKNYQISQYDIPLSSDGSFAIPDGTGGTRSIGIIRAHLEEDAGKNIHDTPGCTLVDLNRTGTPLLEIVTRPDITSGEEAFVFCTELQKLVTYLGVGEGSMEKGQMRFEPNVNVAIERDGVTYHTPIAEVKNLNSFKAVRDAIDYEARRQVQDWLADNDYVKGQAANENRGWNAERGVTEFQRGKEAAHDYRYFPDPDLVPVRVTADWIDAQRAALPELPTARRARFAREFGLADADAELLVGTRGDADCYESAVTADPALASRVAKLMLGVGRKFANERGSAVSTLLPDPAAWRQLAQMVEAGTLNASAADRLLAEALEQAGETTDFEARARELNLIQVRDAGAMSAWVEQAFAANEQAVRDALSNPKKAKAAVGFLTGQVMRVSGGKADPKLVGKLIADRLAEMPQ